MTKEKELIYAKAYVELYELIKLLSKEQRNQIPENFISNIYNKMNKDYLFSIDSSKDLIDQDYMLETKALIVKMYEKYLSEDDEKEFWSKYDKICYDLKEKEKNKKYNNLNFKDNILRKDEYQEKRSQINEKISTSMIVYKESLWIKFKKLIKNIFSHE